MEAQLVGVSPDAHGHSRHTSVARGVSKCLLHHSVRTRLHLRRTAPRHSLMLEVYQNTRLGRISFEERKKRRKQSKLVQVGGPQIEREPPYPDQKVDRKS